jgi:hypothetical protein
MCTATDVSDEKQLTESATQPFKQDRLSSNVEFNSYKEDGNVPEYHAL